MGQYFKAVNIDKKEYIHAHDLDGGLKLPEIMFSSGGVAGALCLLLANGPMDGLCMSHDGLGGVMGRWVGDRVLLAGDYAAPHGGQGSNYYDQAKDWRNISAMVKPILDRENY